MHRYGRARPIPLCYLPPVEKLLISLSAGGWLMVMSVPKDFRELAMARVLTDG